MATYSCRAQGGRGVDQFLFAIGTQDPAVFWSVTPLKARLPDVALEVSTSLSFRDLQMLLDGIDDAYVMRETLRAIPLAENSLERRGDGPSR